MFDSFTQYYVSGIGLCQCTVTDAFFMNFCPFYSFPSVNGLSFINVISTYKKTTHI